MFQWNIVLCMPTFIFLIFIISSQMAKYQQELDDAINQPLPEGDDDDL